MARLDPEARVAIRALVSRGTSYSAIARLLAVTEGAVRYQVARMRRGQIDGRSAKLPKASCVAAAIDFWRESEAAGPINLAALHDPLWDPTFSEHSYGFRPGRSAHQAVAQAQAYVSQGYRIVVDIDLAKFFDRVNHDRLMAAVAVRVSDRRVLRLLRSYLTAGVLADGVVAASREGAPQGGPLSPLLSNLA